MQPWQKTQHHTNGMEGEFWKLVTLLDCEIRALRVLGSIKHFSECPWCELWCIEMVNGAQFIVLVEVTR